jgi:hypothetical protein
VWHRQARGSLEGAEALNLLSAPALEQNGRSVAFSAGIVAVVWLERRALLLARAESDCR